MGSTSTPSSSKHRRLESMYTITGLYSEQSTTEDSELDFEPQPDKVIVPTSPHEKGHKRTLSSEISERKFFLVNLKLRHLSYFLICAGKP